MQVTLSLFSCCLYLTLFRRPELPSIFTFIKLSLTRKGKKRLDILSIEWFFRFYYVKIMNRRFKLFEKKVESE